MTVKTGKKSKCKVVNEGSENEEVFQALNSQLDQLVIQKPQIAQTGGKDKSLKEAFLRRPPNNIITVQYGPIEGRPPTVVFNYPPFL